MYETVEELKELEIEKLIWLIFIFISALNIYGDNIEELFLKSNNLILERKSKNIFIFTIIISLLIYLYFATRNYKKLSKEEYGSDEFKLKLFRLIGSILIIVGTIFILYFEVNEQTPLGTPTI